MNDAQQIFSVFYAIFFGIMLQTIGARRSNPRIDGTKKTAKLEKNVTLNLFDTPNSWAIGVSRQNKPLIRFICSLLMLNVLPGFIFTLVFIELGGIKSLNHIQIIVLIWISLFPNYIYRIYLGLLAEHVDFLYLRDKGKYKEFSGPDLNARAILHNERKQHPGHNKILNHIAIPLFWILPSTILLYYYAFSPISNVHLSELVVGSIWGFLGAGIIFFRFKGS
jgi:hypothetical protein